MNHTIPWPLRIVVCGGILLLSAPLWAEESPMSLTGEIVDPASYLKDGRHGLEMEDATFEAVDGGQTLALLENGTGNLYLFLGAEPGEDPNELAYDYVNQEVTVTGDVYERGGLRGIVADAIEPVEPPVISPTDTTVPSPATPPIEPDNLD